MATQGIVSVMRDNKVILKLITGADGYNAQAMALAIKESPSLDLEYIYRLALKVGFGGEESLVVMDKDNVFHPYNDNEVPPLYRETFNDPKFNPRWKWGTVDDDCLAIVEL